MATLEEAIAERVEQELAQKQKVEAAQSDAEAAQLSILAQKYEELLSNEHFQWWLDTELRPRIKDAHDAALDTKKSAQDRSDQAHRHAALNDLLTSLTSEYERLKNKALTR